MSLTARFGRGWIADNSVQLIAGLFDEARIHLTGLKHMVELRGGITDESIRSASILSAIITYASQKLLV